MMILTGDKSPKISTGNQDSQKISIGNEDKKDKYNVFYRDDSAIIISKNENKPINKPIKIIPSYLGIASYYDEETGKYDYYNLLNLENVISVTKREFQPYDKVTYFENSDYGRINHSFIELDFKTYNKDFDTIRHYYINSEREPKINEIIQGLKDYGFVMSEGTVEEGYGNEYLSEDNRVLGKYIYEKYERK